MSVTCNLTGELSWTFWLRSGNMFDILTTKMGKYHLYKYKYCAK